MWFKICVPAKMIRNVLHPDVVNGNLFVAALIDHYTMLVPRFDENGQLLELEILHHTDFESNFADIRML